MNSPWAQSCSHTCPSIYGCLELMAVHPHQKQELGSWLICNIGAIGKGSLMLSGDGPLSQDLRETNWPNESHAKTIFSITRQKVYNVLKAVCGSLPTPSGVWARNCPYYFLTFTKTLHSYKDLSDCVPLVPEWTRSLRDDRPIPNTERGRTTCHLRLAFPYFLSRWSVHWQK